METSPKPQEKNDDGEEKAPPREWPMSWVFIAIIAYILLQTLYFTFFAK